MAKYVIVGGVAGGATAAARLRRVDEHAEIVLIERGAHISYANCGLPYYIGGAIKERSSLLLQTPQSFGRRYAVDVRVEQEVVRIDRIERRVQIRQQNGESYWENYDKLLLSPGANPIKPDIEGINLGGVFSLRNVSDTDKIHSYLNEHHVRRAVVVGGGFIGLEMAENLHTRGISVDIVELAPQVMAPVDFSIANIAHAHLASKGVGLYLERALRGIEKNPEGLLKLSLSSGETIEADLVLLSIGVRPNTALATDAGLEIGQRGGIRVNEYLQTSDENIYAVGDAIEFPHPITKAPWLNYLAGPANRQARIAASNMAGGRDTYEGSIGTAIAKVFDLVVATTGLAAKALQREGIPYLSTTIHPASHATYYPGASQMTLKLIFAPETGRVLGAQAIGADGVDKRIDLIAQCIKRGGTIEELMQTEQAYAPPFSSAKDPVAQAAYQAENILLGRVKPIYWREIATTSALVVDVRTPEEYALGHIPGAINIPVDDLRERLGELSPERPIVVYCAVGLRGYLASNILRQRNISEVYNLVGGYRLWRAATQTFPPTERYAPEKTGQTDPQPTEQVVDACGVCCPGPILRLKQAVDQLPIGACVSVIATDPGFIPDAQAWCASTGHVFLRSHAEAGRYTVTVQRGDGQAAPGDRTAPVAPEGKTFILFSDDLDKALATFVLANGAAATGARVSIFFTFWGLNAIKREGASAPKDFWGKMFGMMLPKSSRGLGLSKMNMGGLGARMMRMVMRRRGVDSLEALRQQAIAAGVEFIACQMSMDVMGIHATELLPNVTIGGVATYMHRAEQSAVNLFI